MGKDIYPANLLHITNAKERLLLLLEPRVMGLEPMVMGLERLKMHLE